MTEGIIETIIKGIGDQGGTGNVLQTLTDTHYDFEQVFGFANEIQNMDLIKLLYSNYTQNKIIVEFTLLGKARYENLSR
jgi:hypothetical protein